jgi:hypothetical protein
MTNLQGMLVNVSNNYRLIMQQLTGDIQSENTRSSFRGVASGPEARPAATNPESSTGPDSGFARQEVSAPE